jgi:hypothetical protein
MKVRQRSEKTFSHRVGLRIKVAASRQMPALASAEKPGKLL